MGFGWIGRVNPQRRVWLSSLEFPKTSGNNNSWHLETESCLSGEPWLIQQSYGVEWSAWWQRSECSITKALLRQRRPLISLLGRRWGTWTLPWHQIRPPQEQHCPGLGHSRKHGFHKAPSFERILVDAWNCSFSKCALNTLYEMDLVLGIQWWRM